MRHVFPAAAVLAILAGLGGCASGRVYNNGINHVYLCAVRAVRVNGYHLRQQEFKKHSGKMIAARSVPDPKGAALKRGFLTRVAEVARNAWEHGKLEFWDKDLAMARVRTDRRVVAEFKATGKGIHFLGLGRKDKTRVRFSIDITEYGREDWVIRRQRLAGEAKKIHADLQACLGPALVASAPPSEAKAAPVEKPKARERPKPRAEEKPPERPSPPPETRPAAAPAEPAPAIIEVPPPPPAPSPPRISPEELEEALEKGRRAYEKGDFAKTLDSLEPAVAAYPRNSEALGYLGAAFYQLGRTAEAIAMYERYLEEVPTDVRTRDFLKELKAGE